MVFCVFVCIEGVFGRFIFDWFEVINVFDIGMIEILMEMLNWWCDDIDV